MGLKSFKSEESKALLTLPNGLTGIRAVGGVMLGAMLWRGGIEPTLALESAAALAATDMEGLTIQATNRFPRLQRTLRIMPSWLGRIGDPIADKIFAISTLAGGTVGGEFPLWQSAGILATEVGTSITTMRVTAKGGEPETSKPGTWGMVARCATMASDLGAAAANSGVPHEMLAAGGAGAAVASIALGAVSGYKVWHDTPIPQTQKHVEPITQTL